MSHSVRPHRWQPTRLPCPWDFPGNCHVLLPCMKVKSESEVAQSCPTQRPHGLQPIRLLRPWDFPGKSTGVGRHCLLRLSNKEEADRGHGGASCPFSMKRNASNQRTMPVSTPIPLAPKPSLQLSFRGQTQEPTSREACYVAL